METSSIPLVRLDHLTKNYREGESIRTVFTNLTATIAEGQSVALLGRSGSGKSTLLNLISGIDQPDSGDVIIAGTRLNFLSEHERTIFRRNNIGFIFQFFNLIPTLTVMENLLLPLELKGCLDEVEKRKAQDLLEEIGLGDRAETFPDRLSGGEQQRVAIARALVHRPRLLLADEPTGNLDAQTGRKVLDLLDRLVHQAGHTMVMVTHSAEVASRAERILTIREGKLEDSTPEGAT